MRDHVHVVGLGGAGMSALAQYFAAGGARVTGSDRTFDRGGGEGMRRALARAGIEAVPQDGAGIGSDTRFVAVSTAIETGNPDLDRAGTLGIPVRHRSDCLAEIAAAHETVVVTGTSGKSTVTAMLWEILEAAGGASLLTGGPVRRLMERGLVGNVWRGEGRRLVIEGDESDGTLVAYRAPRLALVLNLEKDHKELDDLFRIFGDFLAGCADVVLDAEAPALKRFRDRPGVTTYGFLGGDLRATEASLDPSRGTMSVNGVRFDVPLPGGFNLRNALAAVAAAHRLGVPLETAAVALSRFTGIHRRFESVGTANGVEVIDDFAHNPMKIRAAVGAARLRGRRVLAVWQPHGFAPLRLLRQELAGTFADVLRKEDRLWLSDVYYAGGTVTRDVSSEDVVRPVAAAGRFARHVSGWDAIASEVAGEARPGDVVLVMGARDPTLPDRARAVLAALAAGGESVPRRPPTDRGSSSPST